MALQIFKQINPRVDERDRVIGLSLSKQFQSWHGFDPSSCLGSPMEGRRVREVSIRKGTVLGSLVKTCRTHVMLCRWLGRHCRVLVISRYALTI